MPRLHFITFATPAFQIRQWLLNLSARWFGEVDELHVWTKKRLKREDFLSRHAELFPGSTGFGWYAWKPWIIQQAMNQADEGDLVIYQDVGRREPIAISRSLRGWDSFLRERNLPCIAGVRIPNHGPNRLWTKRSVFDSLGLHGSAYEDVPQIQASWSVWRKTPRSEAFVREWAESCQRLDLVGGTLENGPEGEVPGFKEHRWDQSLLTMLALRDDIPVLDPADRRSPELNEKWIDSFSQEPEAESYKRLVPLLQIYHWVEFKIRGAA